MRGEVELVAGFEPARLMFGQLVKGAEVTRRVKVVGRAADRVALSAVESSRPELRAQLIRVDGKPGLEVRVRALREGGLSGMITVRSGLPSPDKLRLFVSAIVTGDLLADRQSVFFAPADASHPPQVTVRIRSQAGRRFAVTDARDPTGAVKVQRRREGKDWVLELTLQREPTGRRSHIEVTTDRADQRKMSISYWVRPAARVTASRPRQP